MLNDFKVAFLFIGAIIGAGFATGRETALYFSRSNPATIVFTALLTGIFAAFFLFYGKIEVRFCSKTFKNVKKIVDFAVIISVIMTFIAMLAGSETLFFECFGVKNTGLITGLLCAVLSIFSMKSIKNINAIVVPLLIVMTVFLFAKRTACPYPAGFMPARAVNYTAMNMLLGGYLIKGQGRDMRARDVVLTSAATAVAVGALLFMTYSVMLQRPSSSMPVFDFARSVGLKYVAGIIIFFAIFTTMLSSAKLVEEYCRPLFKNGWCAAVMLAAVSVCCFKLDFKAFVDVTYPFIGWFGIAYIALCCAQSAIFIPLSKRRPAH